MCRAVAPSLPARACTSAPAASRHSTTLADPASMRHAFRNADPANMGDMHHKQGFKPAGQAFCPYAHRVNRGVPGGITTEAPAKLRTLTAD
eukprot:680138-Pelagomonas_calceolata.AAC.4